MKRNKIFYPIFILLPVIMLLMMVVLISPAAAATWSEINLPSAAMSHYTTGPDGAIWAIDKDNRKIYKYANGAWTWVLNSPTYTNRILIEPDGTLWSWSYISSGTSYNAYYYNGSSWVNSGSQAKDMTVDSNGTVWMIDDELLKAYKWTGSSWQSTNGSGYYDFIYTAPDGKIWAGRGNHVQYWTGSAWSSAVYLPGNGTITAISADSDGNIWAGTESGDTYVWSTTGFISKGQWTGGYGNQINSLNVAPDGTLWAVGESGKSSYWTGSAWAEGGSIGTGSQLNLLSSPDGTMYSGSGTKLYKQSATIALSTGVKTSNSVVLNSNYDGKPLKNITIQKSTNGVNFTDVVSSYSGSSYTVTGLNPGTHYWFRIARRDYASYHWLYTQPIQDYTLPATPGAPTVTVTSTSQTSVSWTSLTGATSYRLYRDGVKIYEGSGTSFNDTGRTANTRYTYTVSAGNTAGWSPQGAATAKYTLANVPSAGAVTATQTSLTGTWGANGNSAGTLYSAQLRSSSGSVLMTSAWATDLSETFSSLTSGTTHTIYVQAKNGDGITTSWVLIDTLPTIPAKPSTPTGTVTGLTWSNDPNNPGRGGVVVNWSSVPGATGYRIYLFDGNTYRMVQDVGNTTTWDSQVAKIFPAESVLNALTDNTSNANLFVAPTTGYHLPDRPSKLYRKTIGTTYDASNNYWIRVTAYNAGGESPQSEAYMPTLPDRTDTIAPTGSLKINDGATKVTSIDVVLSNTGSDDKSGVYQMQFSNDNVSWSPWETFTQTKEWQIGAGIGQQQTVYMRLKDNAGNISNIISVSVFFASDATPPIIKVSINNGAKQTDSNKVTVYVEASDDFSTIDQITMRVSTNGTDWRHLEGSSWISNGWGKYKYINENFDLGSSGGNKPIFVQAKDAAGNIANATVSIFYVTPDTLPNSTVATPTANATWGIGNNGKYVTVNGEVMQVIQGNSVSVTLTGLVNATELITSFDGINWSQPDRITSGSASFTKDVTWSDEGKKTLYMKVRNEAGVESPVIIRRYLVDYSSATIDAKTASGATLTSGSSINLLIKAKDNVSTTLAYRINGNAWAPIPPNGIVSSGTLTSGRNQLNIEVIDEAGNVSQEVVNVWKAA